MSRAMALRVIKRSRASIPCLWRFSFSSTASGDVAGGAESMASQMVEYAKSFRKKGDAGYFDAMQVLEHGVSFMKNSGDASSLCKVQLTIANFHADQGKIQEAIDVLEDVAGNTSVAQEVRVSAMEALTGLYLQTYQESLALSQVQTLSELDGKSSKDTGARVQALTALVKLAQTQYDAALSCFESFPTDVTQASAILARAEVAHVKGNTGEAKDFYEAAVKVSKEQASKPGVASSVTMSPDEVHATALAGLGQLSTDLGNFDEAEKSLTSALQVVENITGEAHARAGLVLACMADLYTKRAKAESSGFMIAEGLYRRSLSLLKAPPLEDNIKGPIRYTDVVALTRARYGDILSSVEQRASEGEKLKSWATGAWRSQRPLSDVLKPSTTGASKLLSLIDVRLGRVF